MNVIQTDTYRLYASVLDSSESLSRAKSGEIRVHRDGLEHISSILARISERTLDRHSMGIISEQGERTAIASKPETKHGESSLLVTTSYPEEGGASCPAQL